MTDTFYPFYVVQQQEFLTGTLAGLTITARFGICDPADYDVASWVGTVESPVLQPRTRYRIVSATIEANPHYVEV